METQDPEVPEVEDWKTKTNSSVDSSLVPWTTDEDIHWFYRMTGFESAAHIPAPPRVALPELRSVHSRLSVPSSASNTAGASTNTSSAEPYQYTEAEKADRIAVVKKYLDAIQRFISAFEYNHTGIQFVRLQKRVPLHQIYAKAQEVHELGLPIKCREAVYLGLYATLSSPAECIDRIPLSFKSTMANGNVYRHIVLAVRDRVTGAYGVLGLSRRPDLMYKPFGASSLEDVIRDFEECYRQNYHTVLKAYIGLPVPRSAPPTQMVCWKALPLDMRSLPWGVISTVLDAFCRREKALMNEFALYGNVTVGIQSMFDELGIVHKPKKKKKGKKSRS